MLPRAKVIIGIVTVLSVAVLACVLLFTEGGLLRRSDAGSTNATAAKSGAVITFTSDSLLYDGSALPDYMEGVTATDADGTDLTGDVAVSVQANNSRNTKTLMYTVTDSRGIQATATRTLTLMGYKGPSITVSGETFSVDAKNMDTLISDLVAANELHADDGFGHDISDGIVLSSLGIKDDAGVYTASIEVENFLNDICVHTILLTVSGALPSEASVTLTQDSILLPRGQAFDPLSYVYHANNGLTDVPAGALSIDNPVDVNTAGIYTVVYTLPSLTGDNVNAVATLTVTVQ